MKPAVSYSTRYFCARLRVSSSHCRVTEVDVVLASLRFSAAGHPRWVMVMLSMAAGGCVPTLLSLVQ